MLYAFIEKRPKLTSDVHLPFCAVCCSQYPIRIDEGAATKLEVVYVGARARGQSHLPGGLPQGGGSPAHNLCLISKRRSGRPCTGLAD